MGIFLNTKESTHNEKQPLLGANYEHHKEPFRRQYLAAFLASIISFSSGCVGGWSSPATPRLLHGSAYDLGGIRALTVEEISWVASLINLGAFFGSIPAGYFSFKWGRKNYLLSLAVPIIVGWLFIIFNCNNVWFLYIGRFISGISYGSLNVALPIYNNEICVDSIRGRIGILYDLMQCVGLVWVYSFAAVTSLFWVTILCLLIPIIFVLTFIWMPESPLYLVRVGRKEEAIRSIKWLHGDDCNVDLELTRIHQALSEGKTDFSEINNVETSSESDCENGTLCCTPWGLAIEFYNGLSKITIKAVLITFFIFILQRTSGATMVQYYTDTIFQMAGISSPNGATVCIGLVSLISSLISVTTVDFIGRRFLLTFSFFIMALSMTVFIIYLSIIFGETSTISSMVNQHFGFIPTVALCIFVAMFRLGVSPIPWFMTPEIIPTEAQKWAPSTIVCITWGTSFLLSKNFLPAIEAFGQISVYTFFAVVCSIGVIYTWIFIPETKNKSREQIQQELGDPPVSCYEAI